jgi:hypothetical protein
MINIILILKALGLGYIISRFSPLRNTLNFIGLLIKKRNPSPLNILIFESIEELLTCFRCISFWSGLILGGLWIGIISFILALSIYKMDVKKKFFN